jgi:alpha-tubulin suppressor-like RCC1 family protein
MKLSKEVNLIRFSSKTFAKFLTFLKTLFSIKSLNSSLTISLVNLIPGDVYSTGYGYFGQLGHDSNASLSIPKKISVLKNIVQVSCGEAHSIAIAGNFSLSFSHL